MNEPHWDCEMSDYGDYQNLPSPQSYNVDLDINLDCDGFAVSNCKRECQADIMLDDDDDIPY